MNGIMTDQDMTRHPHEGKRLFHLCLFFSLIFHIFVSISLYFYHPEEISSDKKQITKIRLIEKPKEEQITKPSPKKQLDTYELDPSPTPVTKNNADKIDLKGKEKAVDTHRKSDRDQWVEKEQARVGDDARDTAAIPAKPTTPPKEKFPQESITKSNVPKTESKQIENTIQQSSTSKAKEIHTQDQSATIIQPQQSKETEENLQQPIIPLQDLYPDAQTLNRIAQGTLSDRDRTKNRDDVAPGDFTWLNLQSGPLVSFFRRFNTRIDLVWNYPQEAIKDKLQGTVELLIIINKEGELIDVLPTKSSGSDILDLQAIEAVYAAAPFGPLGRHYQHDVVKIKAFFTYRFIEEIPRRYIYGR